MNTISGFARVLATLCFVLLLVGGVVHNTRSSLACGTDWPRCNGQWMPQMTGNVLIEHGHRLLAATVGLLTVALAAALALREGLKRRRGGKGAKGDPAAYWLGAAAVLLVVAQGALGAITVKLGLSAAASTAHLGTSMAFFAVLIGIAVRSRPAPTTGTTTGTQDAARVAVPGGLRAAVLITLALIYGQMVLGAAMRHVGAGLICGTDIPLCHGTWWPSGAHYGVYLHILHRLVGVVVLTMVTATGVWLARATRPPRPDAHQETDGGARRLVRGLALAAPALASAQVLLGMFSVWSLLDVVQVTAHLGGAALLFADFVVLALVTRGALET